MGCVGHPNGRDREGERFFLRVLVAAELERIVQCQANRLDRAGVGQFEVKFVIVAHGITSYLSGLYFN